MTADLSVSLLRCILNFQNCRVHAEIAWLDAAMGLLSELVMIKTQPAVLVKVERWIMEVIEIEMMDSGFG